MLRGASVLAFGVDTQSPVWECREPGSGCFAPSLGQPYPELSSACVGDLVVSVGQAYRYSKSIPVAGPPSSVFTTQPTARGGSLLLGLSTLDYLLSYFLFWGFVLFYILPPCPGLSPGSLG